MNFVRFGKVINNATVTSTFNSDNSNIANIKTQHHKIMITITERFLKLGTQNLKTWQTIHSLLLVRSNNIIRYYKTYLSKLKN